MNALQHGAATLMVINRRREDPSGRDRILSAAGTGRRLLPGCAGERPAKRTCPDAGIGRDVCPGCFDPASGCDHRTIVCICVHKVHTRGGHQSTVSKQSIISTLFAVKLQ